MAFNYENNAPIGIDLGTSNCAIAYYSNTARIKGSQVYNLNTCGRKESPSLMPSSLYLSVEEDDHAILVGTAAENKWIHNPDHYYTAVKRKIGDLGFQIDFNGKQLDAVDLSTEILKGLFKDPLSQNPELNPAGLVVSVPYYFKQHQNDRTLVAINKAVAEVFTAKDELPKVLGLVPEPIAASLYYLTQEEGKLNTVNDRKVLVFDMGGGTFDLTLFRLNVDTSGFYFEVMASEGHDQFGGEDFDDVLVAYVEEEAQINSEGLEHKTLRHHQRRLREGVREAKESLTHFKEVNLAIGNLANGQSVDMELTRGEFEQLLSGNNNELRSFGKELLHCIENSLIKSKTMRDEIDLILLIGGSSQIPYFKQTLQNYFKSARMIENDDCIKYAVAKGAALYAAHLLDREYGHQHQPLGKGISINDYELIFRTTHSLGIEKQSGRISTIIPENTVVPVKKSKIFIPTTFSGIDDSRVKLDQIRIFQGTGEVSQLTPLGFVDRIPTIYAHDRLLEDIRIKVDFEATETTLSAHILIPQSDENGNDIKLNTNVSITNK